MSLHNKIAVVTGGSQGIGKAIAERFIREGARVVVWDIRKPDFDVEFSEVDVRDEKSIVEAASRLPSLDIVVNNAGIYFLESVESTTKDQLDAVVDINLKGPFLVCKHTLPLLKKSRGSIINISSELGMVPEPESPAYCATKAGLIMLTKCMSQEYGKDGVRVNAVLPGPTDTELLRNSFASPADKDLVANRVPLRRIGTPEDVANVAYFLASDEASFITGGLYAVDGGVSASSVYSK